MNDMHSEVLSAFCDGEPVDPDILARALEDPGGRLLVVEFARLRETVRRSEGPLPASLVSFRRRRGWWSARVPIPAAAALVVLALLASLALPWARDADGAPGPPTPVQTLRFEPGVDWHTP
jgi:negative regulator of sigma E activity